MKNDFNAFTPQWIRKRSRRKPKLPTKEEIADYIAEKGITKIEAAPAAELGESTPGWRWGEARSADIKFHRTRNDNALNYHQAMLAQRLGAGPRKLTPRKLRYGQETPDYWCICQFFDKECMVWGNRSKARIEKSIERFNEHYGCIGARFYMAVGSPPPSQISWIRTVKPLLRRQLVRLANRLANELATPSHPAPETTPPL